MTEKLKFLVDGHVMFYTATHIKDDGEFLTFTDKYGQTISYRKSLLLSRIRTKGGDD